MNKVIRIGSRDSELATWQAKEVQAQLLAKNIQSEIIFIKSIGDLVQDKPLNQIGTVGVFTKALDDALLNNEIDIAVHSCKDLPSQLHDDIQFCAFLEREEYSDVLVSNHALNFLEDKNFSGTIATGSVRRKAQLLAQFPNANIVGLRGNVPTRLQKLRESNWSGAVFANAGLKRLGIEPTFYQKATFMVPAPAQGVVAVVCRAEDAESFQLSHQINHKETEVTTLIERKFLHLMEGGCISPIGGIARLEGENVCMTVSILSTDGKEKVEFTEVASIEQADKLAQLVYEKAVSLGAKEIINSIENS